MANTLQLKNDIKKLKGALASKGLSASIKDKLKTQLSKAENELKSSQAGAAPRKVSTTKSTKSTLDSLKELIKKKKYGVYKGAGVDLKKDAQEGALATGRRVSKGLKGNQFGSKKESKGHVYYEYRANRLDVKQPSKKAKYPKLEEGGEVNNQTLTESEYENIVNRINYIFEINFENDIHIADLWKAYSSLPQEEVETMFTNDREAKKALVNTFVEHGWEVEEIGGKSYEKNISLNPLPSYFIKNKMAKGGEMAQVNKMSKDELKNWLSQNYGFRGVDGKGITKDPKDRSIENMRKEVLSQMKYNEKNKMAKGGELDNLLKEQEELEFQLTDIKLGSDLTTDEGVEKYRKLVAPVRAKLNAIDKKLEALGYEPYAKGGKLVGKQKNLDINKNGKLDADDFKMLRGDKMAKGGSTRNTKSKKDLTIDEISSMTGLRKEGIERFADDYELTDSDLSNIMQGLGRKMISSDDFSTAVVGNKNNSYAKEIVDFAKSGKGYKMAKGGETEKFQVDDVVYHKQHNTIGIVRMGESRGEVKTDADGNVNVDELEYYNPMKHESHKNAKIAPSTIKEIEERGLWNPFSERTSKLEKGGLTEKEVVDSNAEMVLSQIKAVKHHADELSSIVSTNSDIEAWVVAKIERASTDLSDITHYLDGQHEKMSMGGSVYQYAHKMDKK